ncbi:MAG: hypothetical protein IJJ33_01225 [Victivallales bacterium]|nr:hypothetical protein [Victivallales bacterium]
MEVLGIAPGLDAIVPPAADPKAPVTVQHPEAIQVSEVKNSSVGATQRVEAATMQDAVNKARTFTVAVTEIKVGSGIGYVASGTANYKPYRNRNASLISQRGAYMEALTKAKGNLAKYLYGMNVEAQEELKNSLATLDTDEETKAVTSNYRTESEKASVEAMLRGYVVFAVEDNPQSRKVTVTIATTPRTRAAALTVSPIAIASTDYRSAMQKLYAELSTGALPPEGARVIVVPDAKGNSQMFCVSFGSSIVRQHKNESVNAQLEEQARRVSSLRAARNMIALLNGDKFTWDSGHTDITKENYQDAGIKELLKKTDDGELSKQMGVAGDNLKETFLNVMKTTDAYKSSVKGKLPPGVQENSWTDDNGDWAYALLVYNPNMTASVIQNRESVEKRNGRTGAEGKTRDAGIRPLDKVSTDANDL